MKRLAYATGIGYNKAIRNRMEYVAMDGEVEAPESDGHNTKRPKRSG